MDDLKFYFSLFLRRLPWFLVVSTVITAVAVAVAVSLPPAYVSQMRLVVESPQIPEDLAASTVRTPALEQLQIIEQRLLTRANLLDIARKLDVLPDAAEMTPDEIVRAMMARTDLRTSSGRGEATMMTVSFEAGSPAAAAGVLNEYLTLIQEADAEFRRGRSGDTLEFFAQEVDRLAAELNEQSGRIIAFKKQNSGALPDSLDFRMARRSELQERLVAIERDISRLTGQRDRLQQLYLTTGRTEVPPAGTATPPSEAELQLRGLERELDEALLVFSEENPKVKLLRARVDRLEADIAARAAEAAETPPAPPPAGSTQANILNAQIAELDSEIELLREQKDSVQTTLDGLTDTIERTPEIASALEELERAYAIVESQYDTAENRLSRAQTGDLIESRSRGQRVAVIEQPNTPSTPTKPNRVLIAGGGAVLGIAAGLGLIVLLELLNGSIRRPEDLVRRFGISPFATIPYIRTRRQVFLQRGLKLLVILAIVVGIPAAIYAMHVYYLPVDLVADKVMNRLGVRW
ncbi:lipopolysaccharide biosynthesis protein [Pseudoruegeria sp. HB172150]|uniref:GumC family protein n=1 Tax=Pseudoruegeria sp. HB172150 TaxID=2721164 RepID=UPI001551835B|nr:lipopolysaccharide biosynthesis protein [Pseudoruegeria sp. HB172150]